MQEKLIYRQIMQYINDNYHLLPVYYPNINYDGSTAQPDPVDDHIIVNISPVAPYVLGLCNGKSQRKYMLDFGIRIKEGKGVIRIGEIVDSIRDIYPYGTDLNGLQVQNRGDVYFVKQSADGWYVATLQINLVTYN